MSLSPNAIPPLAVISPVTVRADKVPTLVILGCAAVDKVPAKVPPVTVPVVVIAEEPTSILPKPDVIEPPFNAPTLVIFVCAAVASVPVMFPEDLIVPVMFILPVAVRSLEFQSKLPPSCGVVSSTTSLVAATVVST